MASSLRCSGRGPTRSFARALSLSLLSLAGAGACTVFDGLSVPNGEASSASASASGGGGSTTGTGGASSASGTTASSASGSGTGGGAGGAGTGGSGGGMTTNPVSYLAQGEAALVCSRAFLCPNLAASMAMSTGVPVSASR